MQNKKSKL